jgi:dopamine beta-monooxygenase
LPLHIGEPPLKFPDGVGVTAGGENGFETFIIEFHYNNPDLDTGLYDNSGVKFYYSLEPPMYEAGVFRMGDPLIDLMNQPVGLGLTQHDFECHSSCTQAFLADAPVTVFKDKLHMHA